MQRGIYWTLENLFGAVAQLVERVVRNDEVESSILFRSTFRKRPIPLMGSGDFIGPER